MALNYFEVPGEGDDFWMLKNVPHGSIRMEIYESALTGRARYP
jgi:hypothetical protein